jgi:hypothetical protein
MADPDVTNTGDLEDLFGDSDDEDFQPADQQQQQPQDDAEAAPTGVRMHMADFQRNQACQLQSGCWCTSLSAAHSADP